MRLVLTLPQKRFSVEIHPMISELFLDINIIVAAEHFLFFACEISSFADELPIFHGVAVQGVAATSLLLLKPAICQGPGPGLPEMKAAFAAKV